MKFAYFKRKTSSTLASILAYVYRKQELLPQVVGYGEKVMDGLIKLGLLKRITSSKGTFYFTTEKAQGFKAIQLAEEYLWAYHNADYRKEQNDKRFILCFDSNIETGKGLVEIEEAIKKCYI